MVKAKKSRLVKFFSGWGPLIILIVGIAVWNTVTLVQNLKTPDYIVETNAFFAPFEFYENREIVGVDVDIINKVAERLGADIEIKNVEFDLIIDNVSNGVIADAGAAGLTITPAREKKVNFSIPYYTSAQYVIYSKERPPEERDGHVVWGALAGKTLGSQMGSTGYLLASDEVENGVLKGTGTEVRGMDSHQLSADAIQAQMIDYAIADQLAAQFIVERSPDLAALPLYYEGEGLDEDYPVEESYAIAVNKQRPELLNAFNEVLTEMMQPGEDGKNEMDKLILKYMGLEENK